MKKITKKIIAILLVLSIIIVAVPMFRVNAENTGNWHDATNVCSENGITLEAKDKYKDFDGSVVILTVDNTDKAEILKGIHAVLSIEDGDFKTVSSLTNDWNVSACNISDSEEFENTKVVDFLVEPTEEAFSSETWAQKVEIKIKYTTSVETPYIWVNKSLFKTTYDNNNVVTPLANISDVAFDFCVSPNTVDGNPIAVKEGFENIAKVNSHDLYLKLDADNDTGVVYASAIRETLKFDDSYENVMITTDSTGANAVSTQDDGKYIVFDEETDIDSIPLGNATKLILSCDYGDCEYNIYEMGNTYIEDVYVGGTININDVTWLRQAVVGMNEALNDPNFRVKASDVNFSNEEIGTLGDIGDIIAIRERILNNTWTK